MAGEIRMDYEATMRAAQELDGIGDLVSAASGSNGAAVAELASWEGAAASKAKLVLAIVSDTLSSYGGAYWQLAQYFVGAAQNFTEADEAAAQAIQAAWDGAYDPASGT